MHDVQLFIFTVILKPFSKLLDPDQKNDAVHIQDLTSAKFCRDFLLNLFSALL
jgi:hypothetical protein